MATSENSVYVSNIANSVEPRTLADFFSFCGKVEHLSVMKTGDGKHAVVQFVTDSAAKTALLLTNAILSEQPIAVAPYDPELHSAVLSGASSGTSIKSGDIDHKEFGGVADDQRSKTSVVASLLAAGYLVGSDTLTKAKDYDAQHSLSATVKAAAGAVVQKVSDLDEQYGVSERVTGTVKSVDQQYKVSERVGAGAAVARDTAVAAGTAVATRAMANTTISSGVAKLQSGFNALRGEVDALGAETKAEIERRQTAKNAGPSATNTDTNADAATAADATAAAAAEPLVAVDDPSGESLVEAAAASVATIAGAGDQPPAANADDVD